MGEGLIRKEITKEDKTHEPGSNDLGKHDCNICNRKLDTKQGCLVHKRRTHRIKQQKPDRQPSVTSQKKLASEVCGEAQTT